MSKAADVQFRRAHDLFSKVAAKSRLTAPEVKSRLVQVRRPAYWRELNPELSVTDHFDMRAIRARKISAAERRSALQNLKSAGYFQIDDLYPASLMQRLKRGVEIIQQNDWPPMFVYIYDEYWLLKRSPSLVGLLDEALGPDHLELRNSWCHYIQPIPGAHGWAPHMDGPNLEGRMSVWFPLTDATLDNGCIYIIPENRVPASMVENFNSGRRTDRAHLRVLLQAAKALPVRSGSLLAWNFRVPHWGSTAGTTTQPRVSITTEFARADAPDISFDCLPIESHTTIPTFDVRLEIIGRAIQAFQTFEPKMVRWAELASHLWKR